MCSGPEAVAGHWLSFLRLSASEVRPWEASTGSPRLLALVLTHLCPSGIHCLAVCGMCSDPGPLCSGLSAPQHPCASSWVLPVPACLPIEWVLGSSWPDAGQPALPHIMRRARRHLLDLFLHQELGSWALLGLDSRGASPAAGFLSQFSSGSVCSPNLLGTTPAHCMFTF